MSDPTAIPSQTSVIVDTNVLSYVFKGDSRAGLYQPHLIGPQVVLSFMTVAELERWAEERHWGPRTRERLEHFLAGFAIHYPDRALCALWGTVMAMARHRGRPISEADAWIAATALFYGVSLVTNNPEDFAGVTGLRIITERIT